MNSLISITNLNVNFQNQPIFKNFNLEVYENEILMIIGQSGVGKSTLLHSILQLIYYDGQININSKSKISYMPQSLALFENMSVVENVLLPIKINGINNDSIDLGKLLAEFNLLKKKNQKINNLSGGEKSRVALLRAIVENNKIILLDEPLSKLDPVHKKKSLNFIKKIQQKYQLTIIYVTHDYHEVKELADRILVINKKESLMLNQIQKIENLEDKLYNLIDC